MKKTYPHCKCTFTQYMVGDGCDQCNPAEKKMNNAREKFNNTTHKFGMAYTCPECEDIKDDILYPSGTENIFGEIDILNDRWTLAGSVETKWLVRAPEHDYVHV